MWSFIWIDIYLSELVSRSRTLALCFTRWQFDRTVGVKERQPVSQSETAMVDVRAREPIRVSLGSSDV